MMNHRGLCRKRVVPGIDTVALSRSITQALRAMLSHAEWIVRRVGHARLNRCGAPTQEGEQHTGSTSAHRFEECSARLAWRARIKSVTAHLVFPLLSVGTN